MTRFTAVLIVLLTLVANVAPALAADPKPRDARIGGFRDAFEQKYGEAVEEQNAGADEQPEIPDLTVAGYEIEAFSEVRVSYYKEKAIEIVLQAEREEELAEGEPLTTPDEGHWDVRKAARYAKRFLPRDVECDREQPVETTATDIAFRCHSADSERAFSGATLALFEVIGAPGDLFYRLLLDDAGLVYAVELGFGDGTRPAAFQGDGVIGEATAPFAPVRIIIPAIGVDAGIEPTAIVDNVMGIPSNPWNVGWYPSLSMPGDGGNAVMAGHVDWYGIGPVVFAGLAGIGVGAPIYVVGPDGLGATYAVSSVYSVPWDTPATQVIGPTGVQSLTLITCTGTFNGSQYDQRLIVRADRI